MGTNLHDEKRFIRAVYLRQLGPVGMSVLLVQLSVILNNVIVGNIVGGDALAVMSAVNPVYFTFTTVGALLATGGSTLTARTIGENDPEKADGVFSLSVISLVVVGAVLTIVGLLRMDALLYLLGVPPQMTGLARGYLTAYLPGAIGVMGIYVPFNYLKLVGKQNQSVMLFLVMAMVNLALDGLLAGVLGMGMTGVAIATIAGAWTAFLFGMALLCGKKGAFHIVKPQKALSAFAQMIRFGSPSAANNLCNTLFTLFMNRILLGHTGAMGLAAFSLIMTLRSFSMSINNGVSMTMAPFAAVFSSERDSESLRQLLLSALVSGIALMFAYSGLVLAFPAQICALFGVSGADRLAVTIPAIRFFAMSLPVMVVNYTLIAFYANQGKTMLSNAMTILRALALIVPITLLLSVIGGKNSVWLAFLLSEAGTLVFGLSFALLYSRSHPHTSRLALIDTGFEDDGRYIAFSVAGSDEAATLSAERITQFCEANELPPKTAMTISLAIEEMIVILNRHALEAENRRNGKLYGSTVRLLIYRADTVMLRIRCFGKPFNPIEAREDEEDGQEYIGVRMIQKLAKTVVYTHTFGINNLTITI
ncbi:MAG: MATE family efflux transporter [Clostridia bacterium]|nr:MATE family efflux transporter [Clostridia bacterium]